MSQWVGELSKPKLDLNLEQLCPSLFQVLVRCHGTKCPLLTSLFLFFLWKLRAPSILPLFDPSDIQHTTAFVLRIISQTTFGTVYYCTCARYSIHCTLIISWLYCTVQPPGTTMQRFGEWIYSDQWETSTWTPSTNHHTATYIDR
jgi:hypothetical protein